MFERLLALFASAPTRSPTEQDYGPLQRALAVLLVIVARLDGRFAPEERETIVRLLRTRLGVEDSERLIDEADEQATASTDLYQVTRIIKDRLEPGARAGIIESLWEVIEADGEVHDYEASLVRRVAGLLHVPDRDSGEARKRVTERRARRPASGCGDAIASNVQRRSE